MNNLDKFAEVYAEELTSAVTNYPEKYAYSVTLVPTVVEKMKNAFKNKSYNKDSIAIKNTCKKLGIKHTYTAINEFVKG